ncbi:hypothetical protein EOD42_04415 [Rhodovarius crocodyli]|uniref:Zinc finger/thioredoxin putative domain-containing protein n=1 Tax=Rhodovarius crocodyli TaxID=1979269 RepID=A0A437MNZ5_9PROT|nr:zinc-ribbon domain-containing protein [Rhodovarius crocodyli]RVT99342.1 hypothetical protein EOD42_04415 [Rhodovarius crocodyli]
MLIACPACDATYQVPDHLVAAGRQMRCAKCGHDWHFVPEVAPSAERRPEPVEPAPVAAPPLERPVVSTPPTDAAKPGKLVLALAWVASVLAVAGGVAALFLLRVPLAEAWPPLERLYGWVGL